MNDPAAYAPFLWLFTILLVFRVAGQIIVVLFSPRWLPPMGQWQSGLLPYPVLLAAQACVLALMFAISADFSHGSGFFVQPHTHAGAVAVWFGAAYASGMVFRYINRMTRRPDQRWLGGTIPIIFHTFVAAFLWTFGRYHTQ
jgi:uncharacterized protein